MGKNQGESAAKNGRLHRASMLAGKVFSSIPLASYLLNVPRQQLLDVRLQSLRATVQGGPLGRKYPASHVSASMSGLYDITSATAQDILALAKTKADAGSYNALITSLERVRDRAADYLAQTEGTPHWTEHNERYTEAVDLLGQAQATWNQAGTIVANFVADRGKSTRRQRELEQIVEMACVLIKTDAASPKGRKVLATLVRANYEDAAKVVRSVFEEPYLLVETTLGPSIQHVDELASAYVEELADKTVTVDEKRTEATWQTYLRQLRSGEKIIPGYHPFRAHGLQDGARIARFLANGYGHFPSTEHWHHTAKRSQIVPAIFERLKTRKLTEALGSGTLLSMIEADKSYLELAEKLVADMRMDAQALRDYVHGKRDVVNSLWSYYNEARESVMMRETNKRQTVASISRASMPAVAQYEIERDNELKRNLAGFLHQYGEYITLKRN